METNKVIKDKDIEKQVAREIFEKVRIAEAELRAAKKRTEEAKAKTFAELLAMGEAEECLVLSSPRIKERDAEESSALTEEIEAENRAIEIIAEARIEAKAEGVEEELEILMEEERVLFERLANASNEVIELEETCSIKSCSFI